jgi:hypothetical protein
MELLTGELRLLKSAIELMSGRLELMLSEIADLRDARHSNEEFAGQTELQQPHRASSQKSDVLHFPELLDAPSPCTSHSADAIDDAPSVVSATEEELPVESLAFADQSAQGSRPDTAMPSVGDTVSLDGCGTENSADAILETLPAAASELPPAVAATPDGATIAPPDAGDDASNIIVLDDRRKTSPRRNAVRAVAHCAASLAMIVLIVAVATSSGFTEFLVSKARATPDAAHIVLPAAAF